MGQRSPTGQAHRPLSTVQKFPVIYSERASARTRRTAACQFSSLFQALTDKGRSIPAQYPGFIGLFAAFNQPDLLGATLFGNLAKFRRDSIRINKFFRKAAAERQNNNQ